MPDIEERKDTIEEEEETTPGDREAYRALRKQYRALEFDYIRKKNAIKDAKKEELERLRDEYQIEKLSIEKPKKAERYRIKADKRRQNRKLNEAPKRKLLEEIGNAVSHGVGALIGIACLVLMILKAKDSPWHLTAAIIYGTCFTLQMLFSCLYHSFRSGTTVKRIFRRFDYTSIYLAIGGTFAPLYLIYMAEHMWGMTAGLIFFAIQWAFIALGVTFVGVFGPGRIRWLHFTLYFAIGWSALMFIPFWIKDAPYLFVWILSGGLAYTLGMIPFGALKKKPVAHFIWHLCVLIGSLLMWAGIYMYVF
ncbi:MAG: hemolysin III family protein [Bacilli bacterium]|nr:hemolysin III family protein [Bacilli bacterium]